MFCKHCGKEITGDAKFCNNCGKSQDNSSKSITKSAWIIYLIWTVANLYMLIAGGTINTKGSFFYPFTAHSIDFWIYYNWDESFYDFSEFLVFVFVVPAFLYVVYRRYSKQIDKIVNTLLKK